MLVLTISLAMLLQGASLESAQDGLARAQEPATAEWVEAGGDERWPAASVVRGPVELTPQEADAAAAGEAMGRILDAVRTRGAASAEAVSPAWLPNFVRSRAVSRWLAGLDTNAIVNVVDRARQERDHGGGERSYRTALLVEPRMDRVERELGRLHRIVRVEARTFTTKCLGIVAFWVALALAYSWLDRASRGYMTWRLRLLGAVVGLTMPTILLLV
jgi:hypothetical protein